MRAGAADSPAIDRKKYVRLANRIVVKAIETEEEFDRMVAAVEEPMDKGENIWPSRFRPTRTATTRCHLCPPMRCWLT